MRILISGFAILLLVAIVAAAKGQHKRQVQGSDDENEPPRQRRRVKGAETPTRRAASLRPVDNRQPYVGLQPQSYVGLQPQALPEPHINETGYYNLPPTFWFSPDIRDARRLAENTHDAIAQIFASYPQNGFAMARMEEQLDRHRRAWFSGIRARFISHDSRQGRHDPQFDNWDDMQEYLQQLWTQQYEHQLRLFLAMYRDYLLRLLATWFDSFGVPRRDDSDDDPSGLPYHPGPTGVSRNS